MLKRRNLPTFFLSTLTSACIAAIVGAAEPAAKKDVGSMRGPLDRHATWVREITDSLELSEVQRAEVNKIVDEGHAAWREWFEANHEKVAAHQSAVQEAKESDDKAALAEAKKKKKAFMHTAPSIFRHPEPVRDALPESLRGTFDELLKKKIKEVHTPKSAKGRREN